ncbi:MAG: GNAT family N-acetyltransferase [Bacteroidaceae bacterium]|nr:GNAT family N-acetyltransferase [Bacteroidaceae bacterium]
MKWEFSALEDWNEVWSDEHLEQWTKLLYSSPTSHVFFHPDLVRIWVETYLPLRDFHPIFVWGNSDDNKVFIPLVLWRKDWRGAFMRSIVPVGYSDYDYHDPLWQKTCEGDDLSFFWDCLLSFLESFGADEIVLSGIREHCSLSNDLWIRDEMCPSLDVSKIHGEGELMLFLGTKLRGDIRRQLRRLKEKGCLRYVEYASTEELPDTLFENFMEAHSRRWPNAYKPPHFHEKLVASRSLDGPIHFSAMLLDGIAIAWHLGFEFQNTYYYYMPAGNPDYAKYSPVKIHLYHLMVRAINRGYVLYDHLRGDETYKSGWSDGSIYVHDLFVARKGFTQTMKRMALQIKRIMQ